MSNDEIINAYNVLAQDVQNQAAERAAQIGNAQRSLGTLAGRVASPTQTSGLANYTYNRLIRPTVDTTAAALVTQGKAKALEKMLSDQLTAARNAYEDAKNQYQINTTLPYTQNQQKLGVDTNTEEDTGDVSVYEPQPGDIIPNTDVVSDYQDPATGQWYILASPTAGDALILNDSPLTANPTDGKTVTVNGRTFRFIGATNQWYWVTPSAGPNTYSARTK